MYKFGGETLVGFFSCMSLLLYPFVMHSALERIMLKLDRTFMGGKILPPSI